MHGMEDTTRAMEMERTLICVICVEKRSVLRLGLGVWGLSQGGRWYCGWWWGVQRAYLDGCPCLWGPAPLSVCERLRLMFDNGFIELFEGEGDLRRP